MVHVNKTSLSSIALTQGPWKKNPLRVPYRAPSSVDSLTRSEGKEGSLLTQSSAPLLAAPVSAANALSDITEAFCCAYFSLAQGTIGETKCLGVMQQTEQTLSQIVVQSSDNAITQEKKAIDLQAQLEQEEAHEQAEENGIGQILEYCGIGLVALLCVVSVFCGGEAALPEEVEEGVELTDMASSAGSESASASSESSQFISDVGAESSENSEVAEESEQVQNNSSLASRAAAKADNFLPIVKKIIMFAGGAMALSPQIMRGIYQTFYISKYQQNLSDAQRETGPLQGELQRNTMYFQYFQQTTQRQGDVIQGQSELIGNTIRAFASIMNSYRQMPQILAQAV